MGKRKLLRSKLSQTTRKSLEKEIWNAPWTIYDLNFKPERWWEKEEYDAYDKRLRKLKYYDSFVHLNVHTKYSLGYGICGVKELIDTTKQSGMKAVAITDVGNMKGVYDFCKEAGRAGIRPIIGCEFFLVFHEPHGDETFESMPRVRLTLLAMDLGGYQDILKLLLISDLNHGYENPYITITELKQLFEDQHSSRFVGIASYILDEIPEAQRKAYLDSADNLLDKCQTAMGDAFFIGIQKFGMPVEETVEERLSGFNPWGGYHLPAVAVNDVVYLNRKDYLSNTVERCISVSKTMDQPGILQKDRERYLKTPEEMKDAFTGNMFAIKNTWAIASQCSKFQLDRVFDESKDKPILVRFRHDLSYWRQKLNKDISDDTGSLFDVLMTYAKDRFECSYSYKIISYGKCSLTGAIMQTGRAMNIPDETLDHIRTLLPLGLNVTIDDALKQSKELEDLYREPEIKSLMDTARVIQELPLNFSTHATAFVISKTPLTGCLPLRFIDEEYTIEWPLSTLEEMKLSSIQMEDVKVFNL